MLSVIFLFLKDLLSGELYNIWQKHQISKTAQNVANRPQTNQEWEDAAKNGDL